MTSNFFLNNLFSYRYRRLSSWRLAPGLLSFYLICAVGAVIARPGTSSRSCRYLLNHFARYDVAVPERQISAGGSRMLESLATSDTFPDERHAQARH
jgi:hypothetical protein